MEKKNKIIIVIIIILVIYFIIMNFLFRKDSNTNQFMVIDNNLSLRYSNGTYYKVERKSIEDSSEYFKTYIDNKYYGKYRLKYGTVWNLFDKDDNFKSYNGYLFATNMDLDIHDIDSRSLNEEEKEIIRNNYDINNFNFLFTDNVIDIDLNNDGKLDKLVCLTNSHYLDLSNVYIENYNDKNNYSILFAIINDKIIKIKDVIGEVDVPIYDIKLIYNFKNDKNINILLEETHNPLGDSQVIIDNVYKYSRGKFVKTVSNYEE